MEIAVIGGGVFGAMTALRLAETGHAVRLFERRLALMQGASHNANRLHLGFHYPRDAETARQCAVGFSRFKEEFEAAVLPGLYNAYFIASQGTLTTPAEFVASCRRLGLPYREIDLDQWHPRVENVELGILTEEVMYDPAILRRLLTEALQRAGVKVHLGREVTGISRGGSGGFILRVGDESDTGCDAVVNCCYADINRLTAQLGHRIEERQYEYVAVPVIELDLPQLTSITVLDGPFLSLLPFGHDGRYLLYHVGHSVIEQSTAGLLDPAWLSPEASPFARANRELLFRAVLESCGEFVPALRKARLVWFLEGPRMVLPEREDTDGRPSIVTRHEPGYVTVFSGKVDHSVWVAEEVVSKVGSD